MGFFDFAGLLNFAKTDSWTCCFFEQDGKTRLKKERVFFLKKKNENIYCFSVFFFSTKFTF